MLLAKSVLNHDAVAKIKTLITYKDDIKSFDIFCNLYDTWFGQSFFSIRRIGISLLVSFIAVIAVYSLYFNSIIPFEKRSLQYTGLVNVLGSMLLFNFVPDILTFSLTRCIVGMPVSGKSKLSKLLNTQSHFLQFVFILIVTTLFGACLAWLSIYIHASLIYRISPPTISQIIGGFTFYSVFFYSTLLMQFLLFVYVFVVLAFGLLRPLLKWTKADSDPGRHAALVSSIIIFALLSSLEFIVDSDDDGGMRIDTVLCTFDPKICFDRARLSKDPADIITYINVACKTESTLKGCAYVLEEYFESDSEEINALWKKSCDGGLAKGCGALGLALTYRGNKKNDLVDAVKYFQKGCNGSDTDSCVNLGVAYQNGMGVNQDRDKAIELHRDACDQDNMGGCANFAALMISEDSTRNNVEKMRNLLDKACAAKLYFACINLGKSYAHKDVNGDVLKNRRDAYRRACNRHISIGCVDLGETYEAQNTDGGYATAAKIYSTACENRDSSRGGFVSCVMLINLNMAGKVAPNDPAKDNKLLEEICDRNVLVGCVLLGQRLEHGTGMIKDFRKSVELYRKACSGELQIGCSNLGVMYVIGLGVLQNPEKGMKLLKDACDGGDRHGCSSLKKIENMID